MKSKKISWAGQMGYKKIKYLPNKIKSPFQEKRGSTQGLTLNSQKQRQVYLDY
jgi:hypothetical protein